jgi:hypothetical protein
LVAGPSETWLRNMPEPEITSWTDANDNDISFTVPAGERWNIHSIWVNASATATTGNRSVRISFTDSGGTPIVDLYEMGLVLGAGQTRRYSIFPGAAVTTSVLGTFSAQMPLPVEWLRAGSVIRIRDTNDADDSDDFTIRVYHTTYRD